MYPVGVSLQTSDSSFHVIVPDLNGCTSTGNTVEEAIENVAYAIAISLSEIVEQGGIAPLGSPISTFMGKQEFVNYAWAFVNVPAREYMGNTEKISVSIPAKIIHKIDQRVCRCKNFRSRSEFLATAAELLLSSVKPTQDLKKCTAD